MLIRMIFISSLALFISACSSSSSDPGVQSGVFLDSAVFGLRYETATKSGTTNAEGSFSYISGETIKFYIGDILLGSALAKATMTPLDLVAGATDENNPQVTNLARFLQTLDTDNNPDNGINIDSSVTAQAAGQVIDFNLSISDFENDINVMAVIDFLTQGFPGGSRALVLVADAQAHLNSTLGDIANAGAGTGTVPNTGSFGTLTIAGTDTGVIGSSYSPTIAIPSLSAQIDRISWSFAGSGGLLSASKVNNGVGDNVTLVFPVSGSITETYTYSVNCIIDLSECQKFTIDTATKTVTFNNIVLTVIPSNSAITNVATAPVTLSGSLIW